MVSFTKWLPFVGSRRDGPSREKLKGRSRFIGQSSLPASTSSDVESGGISRYVLMGKSVWHLVG